MLKKELSMEFMKAIRRYERAERIMVKQEAEIDGLRVSLESARMFVAGLVEHLSPGKETKTITLDRDVMFKAFTDNTLSFNKVEGNEKLIAIRLEMKKDVN